MKFEWINLLALVFLIFSTSRLKRKRLIKLSPLPNKIKLRVSQSLSQNGVKITRRLALLPLKISKIKLLIKKSIDKYL